MKYIWNKIIFPLSGAIGLINLGKDIYPAFITFSQFIYHLLYIIRYVRNIILLPLSLPLQWFNIELLDWFKSYLFIGLLSYNAYNLSHLKICGSFSHASIFMLFFGRNKLITLFYIIIMILTWPLSIFGVIIHYYKGNQKIKHNLYTLWGEYLISVIKITFFLIFINWVLIQVSNNYHGV